MNPQFLIQVAAPLFSARQAVEPAMTKCKRLGCNNSAAPGQAYCSEMCAPFAHLRFEEIERSARLKNANRRKGPKTHCRNGHPLIPANLYIEKRQKRCKLCTSARRSRNYRRKKFLEQKGMS